jgi:predicted phage baseplate assembly protein
MSKLTPDLFQRRFSDLMEIGRARLRPLAPEWTDYNAHDPGITLMELLAWVSEAQLYSLSRLRRDERRAYSALLGLSPAGTHPAAGMLWPDRQDVHSPAATFTKNVILTRDSEIGLIGAEEPVFRPLDQLLWTPGKVKSLITRHGGGRSTDHTKTNQRGGIPFLPFGERAGRRDVLAIAFECRDEAGLLGDDPANARGARWAIGMQAAAPASDSGIVLSRAARPALIATLVAGNDRFPLTIAQDSTQGFLATGALLLDLSGLAVSPREFTIELRARRGFARPPRVLRIEPNVIPIRQGRTIDRELHVANGLPDWSFTLNVPGLRFEMGEEPITLEVAEFSGLNTWKRCERLDEHGPEDKVYELDAVAGKVTFGNGVNGRIPPRDSQVLVSYSVCDGEEGGVARNRRWRVAGFPGVYGINPDPVSGGSGAPGSTEQRREARRRTRDDHALVTSEDLEAAALSLPLLEVARAWAPTASRNLPKTGEVVLIVMRARPGDIEPEEPPETSRWLEAIRRSLAPRMLLGSRLTVRPPRYVDFSIATSVETSAGRDPASVREAILQTLRKRLALVERSDGTMPRKAGAPLAASDVSAWIRATPGVSRLGPVELRAAAGAVSVLRVPSTGLPRWNEQATQIEVKRADKAVRQ